MDDPVQLEQVQQDVYRTFNQDGLLYLFMGILLGLVGLSFFSETFSFLGGLAALLIFPMEWVRRRITYPRVGYVQFRTPAGMVRGIVGFAAAAVLLLTVVAFVGNGRFANTLPIFIAFVFGFAFFFGASLQGLRWRDWLVIGLMLVGSILVVVVMDDWHRGTAVQMWIVAALLMAIGAVDLIRFLRTHPIVHASDRES